MNDSYFHAPLIRKLPFGVKKCKNAGDIYQYSSGMTPLAGLIIREADIEKAIFPLQKSLPGSSAAENRKKGCGGGEKIEGRKSVEGSA